MPPPLQLQYAAPDLPPTRPSKYSVAGAVVSAASIAWFFSPVLIFEASKQDRVGMMIGFLGIMLAMAGYRQPHCKRILAYIGFWLGIVGILLNFMFPAM